MTIRLMLADDHRMLREGLRRSMTESGFEVVGDYKMEGKGYHTILHCKLKYQAIN